MQSKFAFSGTLKHITVELQEQNTRAKRTNHEDWAIAVVKQRLPMNTSSRIAFQINNPSEVLIGVCFRKVVEQQGFLIEVDARTLL